jgi:hypothetical protein
MAQQRQPAGIPTGGQFAQSTQGRAGVALEDRTALDRLAALAYRVEPSDQGLPVAEARRKAQFQAQIFLTAAQMVNDLPDEQAVEYAKAIGYPSTGALYEVVQAGVSVQEYLDLKALQTLDGDPVDDQFAYTAADLARMGVTAAKWRHLIETYDLPSCTARLLAMFTAEQVAPWMAAVRAGKLTRFARFEQLHVLIRSGMSVEQATEANASTESLQDIVGAHQDPSEVQR